MAGTGAVGEGGGGRLRACDCWEGDGVRVGVRVDLRRCAQRVCSGAHTPEWTEMSLPAAQKGSTHKCVSRWMCACVCGVAVRR
jgi:hypothetical protein